MGKVIRKKYSPEFKAKVVLAEVSPFFRQKIDQMKVKISNAEDSFY